MRIYLMRHGMSRANKDWSENTRVADHAIQLADEGHEEARGGGLWLREHLVRELGWRNERGVLCLPKIRLWTSPYTRTRQTADVVEATCRPEEPFELWRERNHGRVGPREAGLSLFLDRKEHLLLAEQQFGLFDGLTDEERAERYPAETAYYEKAKAFEGKLWPQMPLGESRFEVCQRVHQAFGTFHRDARKHGIDTIVVVAHGTVNRCFVQMWRHHPYEWMDKEPNPANCSIRLLAGGEDHGVVYEGAPGHEHGRTTKEAEQ